MKNLEKFLNAKTNEEFAALAEELRIPEFTRSTLSKLEEEYKPKPQSIYNLKQDDPCFILLSSGAIKGIKYDPTAYEKELNLGNIFLTNKEAILEKKKREVKAKVQRYSWKNPPKDTVRYFPTYDINTHKIYIDFHHDDVLAIDYFEYKKDISAAVFAVGRENFIKYYLGVED